MLRRGFPHNVSLNRQKLFRVRRDLGSVGYFSRKFPYIFRDVRHKTLSMMPIILPASRRKQDFLRSSEPLAQNVLSALLRIQTACLPIRRGVAVLRDVLRKIFGAILLVVRAIRATKDLIVRLTIFLGAFFGISI